MIYLFVTFFIYVVLIIIKNHKSRRVIWLLLMLSGFCISFSGLAFYTEFISNGLSNTLFDNISEYIWQINYYLNLDMFNIIRILDFGVLLYVYSAVCFPLSYINRKTLRKRVYILSAALSAVLFVIIDPRILMKILNLPKSYLNIPVQYLKIYPKIISIINLLSNSIIKLSIVVSLGIFVYLIATTIPVLKKRYIYMFLGIIPIHILFFILFYKFPNNSTVVIYMYSQLSHVNLPYNKVLYDLISYIAFFSVVLQIYAIYRYNILETNSKKNRITFQNRFDTANTAMKVFSHSIKNQLITIRLLTEHLIKISENKPGPDTEIYNEIMSVCNSSIQKLTTLYRETKTGVISLDYEYTDIVGIIKKTVEKYEMTSNGIHFTIDAKTSIRFKLDGTQLEKVLDNIMINSVEACGNGENPAILVKVEEVSNFLVITVCDNGIGIDKKNIGRIFDPFFSTKPMTSNWGIGLSYCQKVIEAFGGVISISSELEKGTSVDIYIPSERE